MAKKKPTTKAPPPRGRAAAKLKREAIVANCLNGLSRAKAAALVGVPSSTLYDWLDKQPGFLAAIERAEAEFTESTLEIIKLAAFKSWQAAAWLLERRFPGEFANRPELRVVHSGKVESGPAVQIGVQITADPESRRLASRVLGRLGNIESGPSGGDQHEGRPHPVVALPASATDK